jgi:hypothetical protein
MQGRSADPLDQRFDRWISRGRDFVDGVAGARPGSRGLASGGLASGGAREGDGERRGGWRHELDGLGRWVETRLDSLLDDESDWREPWQEDSGRAGALRQAADRAPQARQVAATPPAVRSAPGRRALEAISRRGPGANSDGLPPSSSRRAALQDPVSSPQPRAAAQVREDRDPEPWPDDGLFTVPRWSRPLPPGPGPTLTTASAESAPARPSRDHQPAADGEAPSRPLPRSSRRRTL